MCFFLFIFYFCVIINISKNDMDLKILDFNNNTNNISLYEILKKYSQNQINNTDEKNLNKDDLSSILGILFAVDYHYPEINEKQVDEVRSCLKGNNKLFNITSDFGRHLIENLDGINKEFLQNLQNKSCKMDNFYKDEELFNFRQTALLDYMNIRNWEYGRFFIQNLSKLLFDPFKLKLHSSSIKNSLEKDENYLKKIGEKIIETKTNLETHEQLLLVFVIKEIIMKNKTTLNDYCIANFIAKDNIGSLNTRIDIMKKTLNDSLTLKWNLNRGKGGPKL